MLLRTERLVEEATQLLQHRPQLRGARRIVHDLSTQHILHDHLVRRRAKASSILLLSQRTPCDTAVELLQRLYIQRTSRQLLDPAHSRVVIGDHTLRLCPRARPSPQHILGHTARGSCPLDLTRAYGLLHQRGKAIALLGLGGNKIGDKTLALQELVQLIELRLHRGRLIEAKLHGDTELLPPEEALLLHITPQQASREGLGELLASKLRPRRIGGIVALDEAPQLLGGRMCSDSAQFVWTKDGRIAWLATHRTRREAKRGCTAKVAILFNRRELKRIRQSRDAEQSLRRGWRGQAKQGDLAVGAAGLSSGLRDG